MVSDIEKIVGLITILAEQTREQVGRERMLFMAEALLEQGVERAVPALKSMIRKCRHFPTIADIEKEMGTDEPDEAEKAREVGERVYAAVCKWGSAAKLEQLETFLGPIGLEVVKLQGGWQSICNVLTYDNAGQLKAQWRELAEVLVTKQRRGIPLDQAPRFDLLPSPLTDAFRTIEAGQKIVSIAPPTKRP